MVKEDISDYCIREFNLIPIDAASSMLATVPIGLHPSLPGYTMAQLMPTMVKQKVILKDGIKMPRNNAKKLKSTNIDITMTKLISTSSTNKVPSPKEVTPPISNNDDDNNNCEKVAYYLYYNLDMCQK